MGHKSIEYTTLDEKMQYYKPVQIDKNNITNATRKNMHIILRKVVSAQRDVYVSDNVK